jgi:hypothetical protein
MVAYNKSEPWASSLLPLHLPLPFHRHLSCALEGTLDAGNKCLLVSCYLPQDHAENAEACAALTTLPLQYPDHLIILGGDFQGDLTSPSDKSCHLRTLPYTRLRGPTLPAYTPTHHPKQATCIYHLLIHDPRSSTTQTQDTENITHAVLDHNGVKATIRIPLIHSTPPMVIPTTNNNEHTRTTRFQFPIPRQPLLSQRAE